MINIQWNLKTCVAVALIATITGFVVIMGIGYGMGRSASEQVSQAPGSPSNPDQSPQEWRQGDEQPASPTPTPGAPSPSPGSPSPSPTPGSPSPSPNPTPGSPSPAPSPSPTPAPSPSPSPSPSPTPTPTPPPPAPTYCGGLTPCYGVSDLSSHATTGNCWGYIGTFMYNLSSFAPHHSGGSSPIANSSTCGKNVLTALNSAPSNSKHTAAKNNTQNTLLQYKVGYYDSSKP